MNSPSQRTQQLQTQAARHLWMHFTRMGAYPSEHLAIMSHGEGAWLYDTDGNRYLDGLAGLFVSQLGHGRTELAAAAQQQASTLGFFPIWSYGHEPAIELAVQLAELAPGDLNRIFFTVSGSEAVETAWKLARNYFRATGKPNKHKVISRVTAYHGTTMGALSITGLPSIKAQFEPLVPGAFHVPNTNRYRPWIEGLTDEQFALATADTIEATILAEGADTVAAVFLEPLQNAGGCFTPPQGYFERVREICDRYDVLLVSDEVICAYGRLGTMFGCERYDYQPDIITTAKGLTSGYSPLGAVLASDRLIEPFLEDHASFAHGITFGGHPVSCAVALKNLQIMTDERVLENVVNRTQQFGDVMHRVQQRCEIVGDVRGDGFFWALELVKDRDTKAGFSDSESESLLRGFLSPELFRRGLVCRADDRGDPVLMFSPPLICGDAEFEHLETVLTEVLPLAFDRIER